MSDAGAYTCAITGTCGEATTETATVVVNPSTSVDEVETFEYALRVLGPTPASSVVRVQITSPSAGTAQFRLIDAQGAYVGSFDAGLVDAGVTVVEMPVNTLATGSYGVELTLNGMSLRGMVLVVR